MPKSFDLGAFHELCILSDDQLVRLLQILCRNRIIQLPCDIHRSASVMLYVICCAEVSISSGAACDLVGFEFAYKEENPAAVFTMMNITLSGSGILCRGTLALPVEQLAVYRIIVVHRSRRVVLICLV